MVNGGCKKKLEEGVSLLHESGISSSYDRLTMEEVENLFNVGYTYLKTRMSFIFSNNSEKAESQRASWSVGYWSKLIKPSHVEKYGTNTDKQFLFRETEYFGRKGKQRRRSYFQKYPRCCGTLNDNEANV